MDRRRNRMIDEMGDGGFARGGQGLAVHPARPRPTSFITILLLIIFYFLVTTDRCLRILMVGF